MSHHRSEEFRKAAVQKYLSRGSRPRDAIAQEVGVSTWSLHQWAKRYGTSPGMKKSDRRPQDWTAAEKLSAVIAYEGLPTDQRGEFLRSQGLHSEHIEGWKKSMQAGLEPATGKLTSDERAERTEDRRKIKELERDLNRKNKALAETTALLIRKKKADLLWGTGENE
jgi:transposase